MYRLFVQFVGVVFVVYGAAFLYAPATLFEMVTGAVLPGGAATIDARATFGGMSMGIGMVMFFLARCDKTLQQGLVLVATVNFGMAAGRTAGILLDGLANNTMFIYLALEIVATLVALIGIKQIRAKANS